MTQYTARLGDGSGYRCGKYTIRTQDKREDWRLRYWMNQNMPGRDRPYQNLVQRWTPSLRWRIARWWRRITSTRR